MNDTIDILFERLNTPRPIFDEVATRTNLIPVAEELKDHPKDMEAIITMSILITWGLLSRT